MAEEKMVTIDGSNAAAYVAHACSEVIAIYPITPSSAMSEFSDEWSAQGQTNLWGLVPSVTEMQSEAGAAGAVHGALTSGALTTTFTASQGLLLMIPNMYKIAGELTPTVFHVTARSLAANGLSIFGDHSDAMAARSTGFAMLFGNSVQEVLDMSLISHAATLKSRIPFMNIYDGFRTSHEVQKISQFGHDVMHKMIDYNYIEDHRARATSSEHPTIKGTSQNSDTYFTARETSNSYYSKTIDIVQEYMDRLAKETGRQYHLFDYYGAADAEQIIIVMGSAAEVIEEAIDILNAQGQKYGLVKVHLFRPFSAEHFIAALPSTVKSVAVLDRTKEPGSLGEPLYEDIRTAVGEMMYAGKASFKAYPIIVGGRYALGGAEFTPASAKAVFDNLKESKPKNKFTVGITDDVTHTSLVVDTSFCTDVEGQHQAMFYGLGSDGTVGANKNSIKIIGNATDYYCQGYFNYDSRKAGTVTVSHLRFGKKAIKAPYLITNANFIACHKFSFLERLNMLENLNTGGTFLLASQYNAATVWEKIPVEVQQQIIDKKAKFYVIDAMRIAQECGMGSRINIIMQTAFFKISGVVEESQAIQLIKQSIEKTYGRKGQNIVDQNIKTIDIALSSIEEVAYPGTTKGNVHLFQIVPDNATDFLKEVTCEIIAGRGEKIPVSKIPSDGVYPVGTTKYEKRNIAEFIPMWNNETCIACGQCSVVCPHAVIRSKAYDDNELEDAPTTFKHKKMERGALAGKNFTIQISPEDCTGCGACINICPTKSKSLTFGVQAELREEEKKNWDFFLDIPEVDRTLVPDTVPLGVSLRQPLFEFSGACAGCGETPYIKMLSQLFGDRMLIANATGCSSIYGGNLPTHPYATRSDGKGPAWGNSLFEDAAEYGMGMHLSSEGLMTFAKSLLEQVGIDKALATDLKNNEQKTEADIERQRANIVTLKELIKNKETPQRVQLLAAADHLVMKSHWIIGGDGWAYDIGYGGLDHVLASGRNINILVMDTEVYSNTGGQSSKSTPLGAMAKFASSGKSTGKKPLGLMQAAYGYVYVAQISLGANMAQSIKAIKEAEAYNGPSLIIAYSHCINQGINMMKGMDQGKAVVTCGMWPLYRYNPELKEQGKNPFQLDSKAATTPLEDYLYSEVRFKSLQKANAERAGELFTQLKQDIDRNYRELEYLAKRDF